MQRQHIRVASNNHIRPALQRHFQKLVVLRVPAFAPELEDGGEAGNPGLVRQLAGDNFLTSLIFYRYPAAFTEAGLRTADSRGGQSPREPQWSTALVLGLIFLASVGRAGCQWFTVEAVSVKRLGAEV